MALSQKFVLRCVTYKIYSFVFYFVLLFNFSHGNQQFFSCLGIEICVNYFQQRGHTQITAFVPQWRSRTNLAPGYEVYDQHILEELREKRNLVYTPARRVPGKKIVCYDDR